AGVLPSLPMYPEGKEFEQMANLDWTQCPAVESIPGKVSGAWTFRNSRTPVRLVFENLEDGMTIDEIIEQYPVSREEIRAVLDFAAHSLDKAPSF
ncbi:MAG TPA: DUF433 domain-containing protein, partial [Candidatus Solibacter sp.]|nr:DUF433 domain-containing protein [Candidatus Solibacter sp.]